MEGATYQVQLENFAGPLDLLLGLIERRKLDICDISLGKVTNDYLASIAEAEIDPAAANWFLDIASRLIMYKSRALLPNETAEAEPLVELAEQLQELARIRETMKLLVQNSQTPLVFRKKTPAQVKATWYPNLVLDSFAQQYPNQSAEPQLQNGAFRLKRQNPTLLRKKLYEMWQTNQKLELSKLETYCDSHYETLVCFLLTLEMLKSKKANLHQSGQKVYVELV